MEAHLLTRWREQGAEGPDVAGLGALVAYLDHSSGPARDKLVLPYGLHVGSSFGTFGGEGKVRE